MIGRKGRNERKNHIMKKRVFTAALLMIMIIAVLSGCGQNSSMRIENHTWSFRYVQSEDDGAIVACSDQKTDIYPSAEIISLACAAEDGKLTVTNGSTQETYFFDYTVNTDKPESVIYNISSVNGNGFASVGMTEYHDGKSEYTLIVKIGGYAIYFCSANIAVQNA